MQLIIFDCDGTLVDSQHTIVGRMTAAFKGLGYAAPHSGEIRELIGFSLEVTIQRLLPDSNAAAVDHLAAAYQEQFIEYSIPQNYRQDLFQKISYFRIN